MRRIPRYLLQHIITVEPYLGSTAYGETWGAPRQVRALVLPKRRAVTKSDGGEVICTAVAYAAPDPELEIATESRITYAGKTYTVRAAEPYCDSYIELTLEP